MFLQDKWATFSLACKFKSVGGRLQRHFFIDGGARGDAGSLAALGRQHYHGLLSGSPFGRERARTCFDYQSMVAYAIRLIRQIRRPFHIADAKKLSGFAP